MRLFMAFAFKMEITLSKKKKKEENQDGQYVIQCSNYS